MSLSASISFSRSTDDICSHTIFFQWKGYLPQVWRQAFEHWLHRQGRCWLQTSQGPPRTSSSCPSTSLALRLARWKAWITHICQFQLNFFRFHDSLISIHFHSMKSVISGHHRVLTQGLWRFLGRGLKVEPSVWGAQTPRVRVRRWNRTKPMTRLPLLPTSDPHPSPPWWTSARSSCPDPETENINNVKLPHPGSRRQSCINIWVFRKVRISSFHFDIYHLSSFRSVVVHATKDGVLIEMSWTFTFCKKQVVMSVRLKRGL